MFLRKMPGCRFQHTRVFQGRNPNLSAWVQRSPEMVHDHVVGLGRARGPNDVQRVAAEVCCDILARLVHRHASPGTDAMGAGRVADLRIYGVQPGLLGAWEHWGGGIAVKIDHRALD